jgi:hypothetical protein
MTAEEKKKPNHILGFALVHDSSSWQMEFNSGGRRPPLGKEKDLWQEYQRMLEDYGKACKLAWDLYSAAMDITIADFNGLPGDDPVQVVKDERKRLKEVSNGIAKQAEATRD